MNSSPLNRSQTASPSPAAQEYSIIIPKNSTKQYNVMRFNSSFNVDFSKWSQVKIERENNQRQGNADEEMPKFGAGSEFGREAKEEARKKKFGYVSKNYRSEDQPWILKCGGKNGKKFRGVREGGVGENAAYYVFSHNSEGKIEACPIGEWYNFQPIQRYKALSMEEAEQEFGRRNKILNHFSVMVRRKIRNEEDGEVEDGEEVKKTSKNKKKEKDLKISEMDEWMDSDEDDSDSDEKKSEDEEVKANKKKKKNNVKKKQIKKKKKGSDESAVEESDDGDEEGRELDYISDSSDSESDHEAKVDKEMKGVAEESALRKLLTSDEDGSEDEEDKEKVKTEPEENGGSEEDVNAPSSSVKKKKKKLKKKSNLNCASNGTANGKKLENSLKDEESSSDFSPDSSDSELEAKGKLLMKETSSGSNSRSGSPSQLGSDAKRSSSEPVSKKPRIDNFASESGITEEAVRRYLSRKPMTAKELLQKFKKPKSNLSSAQLVNYMTQILKRINPIRQTIKNQMYLSLKQS